MSYPSLPSVETPDPAAGRRIRGRTIFDELQAQLPAEEHELIHYQRLAMLGTLTSMVAHEINNLVTPILARADFALQTNEAADMRKALERASIQARQVVAVVTRLLNLAKAKPQPAERCCLREVIQEATEAAGRPLEKDGIELRLQVDPDLHVLAQACLLEQVLLNLFLNARAAMHGRRGKLAVSAVRDGEHVVVDIRDTGRGIDPERLTQVINPFLASEHVLDPSSWREVGLGLNVCRIIARLHGATIQARNNEQQGCTFRLRWPAA